MIVTDLYCSGCKKHKSFDRFSRNPTKKTGRANWCKDCMRSLYTRPEYLERRKQRRNNNLAHALLIETRCRARKASIPFNLESLTIPELCPVLRRPFHLGGGKRTDCSPSVDRIIPERGYVVGNVRVISWLANKIKSNCDDPEIFEAIAKYLRESVALPAEADLSSVPPQA